MKDNLDIGYQTLNHEIMHQELNIIGNIPEWLAGTFLRNGPAMFEIGEKKFKHWFDGFAMLHSFAFDNGEVIYSNRFLESKEYKKSLKTGKLSYPEFASEPSEAYLGRVFDRLTQKLTDNASVNFLKINDSYLALTETPNWVEFNPLTLHAKGIYIFNDNIGGQMTTPHPHIDYENKEIINFITSFSLESTYNIYKIKEGQKSRKLICSLPTKEPRHMHSFGLTENYIILTEFPLVIHPVDMLFNGQPFIENLLWKPELGTHFVIIDKKEGKVINTLEAEPFYAFHHINAYEKDNMIIIDILAYEHASLFNSIYLGNLFKNSAMEVPEFRRYFINTNNNTIRYEVITDYFFEFPRINYSSYNAKEYRYVYGVGATAAFTFPKDLIKVDINNQKVIKWTAEHCYPTEPVFVASPESKAEDDGVILSVVTDTNQNNSFLLVLDGKSFEEMGRAIVPHCIPFGSHGQYYEEIQGSILH